LVDDREIVLILEADAVTLAQQLADFLCCGLHAILAHHLHIHHRQHGLALPVVEAREQPLMRGRKRHQDRLILVPARPARAPLLLQHADDLERDVVDLDGRADRIGAGFIEETLCDPAAEDGHARLRAHIGRVDEIPISDREVAHPLIGGGDA